MNTSLSKVLEAFFDFLTYPLWRTVSFIEGLVIVASFAALLSVIINAYDIYQERKRAKKRGTLELTLASGSYRRVVSDGFQIVSYFLIGVVFAIAPNANSTAPRARGLAATMLLLAILTSMVYNQFNDYLTRRAAKRELSARYRLLHSSEIGRVDD